MSITRALADRELGGRVRRLETLSMASLVRFLGTKTFQERIDIEVEHPFLTSILDENKFQTDCAALIKFDKLNITPHSLR